MLLAIETATTQLGVAVMDAERLLASYEVLGENPHAVELPHAVARVLKEASTTLERLDAIAVDIGPGSFTGLRIGIAFVKALAFGKTIPVVGIPSLDVLAAPLLWTPQTIVPLLDAKRRNVYAARYQAVDGKLTRRGDYHLAPVEEIVADLPGEVLVLGDGLPLYRETLRKLLGSRLHEAPPELWYPKAATLARLAHERLGEGARDEPSRLVPMYLYPRDCSVRVASASTPSVV